MDQVLGYVEVVSGLPPATLAMYGSGLAAIGLFVWKVLLEEPVPRIKVEVTELEASECIDTPIYVCNST